MKNFKFSVVIPIYKAERYLKNAILSIEKQTYKNFEIILVDDGSPDACPDICDEYSLKYENIRTIHQKNSGVSVARNNGIKASIGDIVCFLDADDEWQETYLEELNILYNKFPNIGSASTARYDRHKDGAIIEIKKHNNKYIVFNDVLKELKYLRTSTYSVKRTSLDFSKLFREGIKRGEDVDLQLRIACHHKHGFINIPLVIYSVDTEFNSSSVPVTTYFPFWEWYQYDYPQKSTLYIYTTGLLKVVLHRSLKQHDYSYAIKVIKNTKFFSYIKFKLKELLRNDKIYKQ